MEGLGGGEEVVRAVMVLILIKKIKFQTTLLALTFPAHLVGSFHHIEMPTAICMDALNIRSGDCANIFKL